MLSDAIGSQVGAVIIILASALYLLFLAFKQKQVPAN
jgi:hypothetical protein